jgi:hypothetical protein
VTVERQRTFQVIEREQLALREHERSLASLTHKRWIVRNKNHRSVFSFFEQFIFAARSKAVVAHGTNFIDKEAIEIHSKGNAKSQARAHAGRIVLYGLSQITPQFCKIFQKGDLVIGVYTVHPADKS